MNKEIQDQVMERLDNYIIEGSAQSGWYTCIKTGKKMRSKQAEEQLKLQAATAELIEAEMAAAADNEERGVDEPQPQPEIAPIDEAAEVMTHRLWVHINTQPKPVKTVRIECEDCGAERMIKPQDQFQVTRCESCQKKHRNKIRTERRRAKRAEKN